MNIDEIKRKIEKDIADEFENIRNELNIYLKPEFHISRSKDFLQTHVPKEVVYKSEILLDTLLNYLMEAARKELKSADIKLQNKFFDMDFRKRIKNWVEQIENKIKLEPDIVKFSPDIRKKNGLIYGGPVFIVGTGITLKLASNIVGTGITSMRASNVLVGVVSGIVTILLSGFTFKLGYDKATPKVRQMVKEDIEKFLINAEQQVRVWLNTVIEAFKKDFDDFCSSHGFKVKGNYEK